MPTQHRERNSGCRNNSNVWKSWTLKAFIGAILIGATLIVGTACSTPLAATASSTPSAPREDVITISTTEVPMPPPQEVSETAMSPKRIISLATGVGETVAALGFGAQVVGRDETSNVPSIAGAEVVTKAHSVSAEKVLSLNPDLVIIDSSTSPPEAIDQIRSTGVKVVEVPEAWTLADIGPRTHAVADALGVAPTVADRVVAESTGSGSSDQVTPAGVKVAFLYLRGTSAVYLIGGKGSGADALIKATGYTDAGAAKGFDAFVPLTAEAVATLDPDVILVMTKGLESVGGIDGLVGLPGVAQTKAGIARHVVAVDDTLLLSFGPRTGNLVQALGKAISETMNSRP